jgi:hypothetical protein
MNMRVHSGDRNRSFVEWVNSLAHNPLQAGSITIPTDISQYRTLDAFYDSVYPPILLARAQTDQNTFRDRAILTVRNDTVTEINDYLIDQLPDTDTDTTFYSVDRVEVDSINTNGSQDQPPVELLQTFNPSSLPPSKLRLKVGAPVILLRNLYPKEGLCNGTRMVVTRISRRCIEGRILGGSFNGQVRLIPRIKLTSTEGELPYIVARTQFPLRLCFAMTVNKSQGQSFNYVGVDLRTPPFTHGQLYVALSRVTNMANLSLLLPEDESLTTDNILYPEVLLS